MNIDKAKVSVCHVVPGSHQHPDKLAAAPQLAFATAMLFLQRSKCQTGLGMNLKSEHPPLNHPAAIPPR
ncbi:hypothetical protein [Tardiphaga sp.]|uniref:hypothetical protein n=1 Tax=Tardiphaga sp. TaxID=1926292 RepID=UPI0025E1A9A0|nr:hypothetical protein [Tardiphaga sp.]